MDQYLRQKLEKTLGWDKIHKDDKCCCNCHWMRDMNETGEGVRCYNKNNEHRFFRVKWDKPDLIGDSTRPKIPIIPGMKESCENYLNKYKVN